MSRDFATVQTTSIPFIVFRHDFVSFLGILLACVNEIFLFCNCVLLVFPHAFNMQFIFLQPCALGRTGKSELFFGPKTGAPLVNHGELIEKKFPC